MEEKAGEIQREMIGGISMLNVTVGTWLESVYADDYYILNISRGRERLFFGRENEVPDDIKKLVIDKVYMDFPSEGIGVKVV